MSEPNKPNDGGPAFPFVVPDVRDPETGVGISQGCNYSGMTLRDYFAAAALPAVISGRTDEFIDLAKRLGMSQTEFTALACYQIADAMLEARKK